MKFSIYIVGWWYKNSTTLGDSTLKLYAKPNTRSGPQGIFFEFYEKLSLTVFAAAGQKRSFS
jgi:hypothetical protein